METALWEYNGTWRLQTDVPKIVAKLKRRKEVDLIGTSPNSNWHIFHIQYSSRKNALKGLTRLSGQECFFNAVEGAVLLKNGCKLQENQ